MENKYQEVLENVKKCCCWCDEYRKMKIDEYNANYEGFEILQELIDKDTPKKPEKIQMIGITNFGLCPECNNSVNEDVGHQYSYCHRCGQALDWKQ